MATDICVLFTANDASMRDFQITIPSDCVAANTQQQTLSVELVKSAIGFSFFGLHFLATSDFDRD